MHVTEARRRGVVALLLGVGLAACSEGPTAPQGPTFDAAEPLMVKAGSSGGGSGRGAPIEGSRTFTIWPQFGALEKFGDHTLYIPPNVVCDPATSGYGAALWDQPCARATQPIQVTAMW